jgi:hypothetical protein
MLSLEDWLGTTTKTVDRLEVGHGYVFPSGEGDEAAETVRFAGWRAAHV